MLHAVLCCCRPSRPSRRASPEPAGDSNGAGAQVRLWKPPSSFELLAAVVGMKRACEGFSAPAVISKAPKVAAFTQMFFGGGMLFGGGGRRHRGLKAAATREANEMVHAAWAASAASRPFQLSDTVAEEPKRSEAFKYFHSLSLADTKSECKMHGLAITGSKKKLFDSLMKHALALKYGNPNRGDLGQSAPPTPALAVDGAGKNVAKVRRALVADLRKCLVFDKKLKKQGARKMLKAKYSNCTPALFQALFTHAAGKTKCSVSLQNLGVDRIGKNLRYGSSVDLVPSSLSAKIDADGTISMSGKYSLGQGGFF
jgi:hypothetical protein